mmetsp:Transcript_39096/g.83193  ORF Transcript_39096/g.83193 Transcript_39096/m.83193 type:complete len:222 (+) Transcript_39096:680-1345(+)
MVCGGRLGLVLLASNLLLCIAGGNSEPTSLRGSSSADATEPSVAARTSSESSPPSIPLPPISSACSCTSADLNCECSTSDGSGVGEGAPEHLHHRQQIEESLKNQTKAVTAWWKDQGESVRDLQCSCAVGSSTCLCNHAANTTEGAAAGEMGMNQLDNLDSTLKNETESVLSMWWAAGGRVFHPYYHPYYHPYFHPYYHPYGVAGGCGCRYYGCRCGHIVY